MKIYNDKNSDLIKDGFLEVRGVKNPQDDRFLYEVVNKVDAAAIS